MVPTAEAEFVREASRDMHEGPTRNPRLDEFRDTVLHGLLTTAYPTMVAQDN